MSVSYLSNKQRKCDFERPSLYRTQALQIIKIKYYIQAVKVNCKKYGYYGVFISHTTRKKYPKTNCQLYLKQPKIQLKTALYRGFIYWIER